MKGNLIHIHDDTITNFAQTPVEM